MHPPWLLRTLFVVSPGARFSSCTARTGVVAFHPARPPVQTWPQHLRDGQKKSTAEDRLFFSPAGRNCNLFFFCSHSICGGAAMRRIYRDTGRNMEYLLRWERKRKPHRHRKRAAVHHNNNVPVWIIFLPPFHLIFSIRSAAFVSGGRESGLCLPLFFFFFLDRYCSNA